MKSLPNIEYKGDISKFIEATDDPYSSIMFYKDKEYFSDAVLYSKFVKNVENMVRTSKDYSAFVSWIKNVLGINFCQVFSKIYDTDATIEMHHGPIFTLYDIVSVILNWFLNHGYKISTFRVANKVLEEHFALRVQVVMMTVTAHEGVHNRDIFNNFNQGIGNLNEFLKLYGDCLDDDHKYKIWNYMNLCKTNPSFDRGILDTVEVKKYIKL